MVGMTDQNRRSLIPHEIHATPADEPDQTYTRRVHLFSVMVLTIVLASCLL